MGQTSKANLNKIVILQKRALRLIYFANKREHELPLFIRANILPVDMLYYKAIANLMHDIHCKTAPMNLIELFTNIDSIHSYNTRSAKAAIFRRNFQGYINRVNSSRGLDVKYGINFLNTCEKEEIFL